MLNAEPARDIGRTIVTTIVDNQVFNRIDSGNALGEISDRLFKRLRFVETWNLDNKFHVSSYSNSYRVAT